MYHGHHDTVIEVGISTAKSALSGHLLGIRKIPVDICNTDMGKGNPFNIPPEIYRLRSVWDVDSFATTNIRRAQALCEDRSGRRDTDAVDAVETRYADLYLAHLRHEGFKRLNSRWWRSAKYQPGYSHDVKRIDYTFMDYDKSAALPSLRSVAAMAFYEWLVLEAEKHKDRGFDIRIIHEGEIPNPAPGDRKTPITKQTTMY